MRNSKENNRGEQERSIKKFWGKKGSNAVGRERGRSKFREKNSRKRMELSKKS